MVNKDYRNGRWPLSRYSTRCLFTAAVQLKKYTLVRIAYVAATELVRTGCTYTYNTVRVYSSVALQAKLSITHTVAIEFRCSISNSL